MGQRLVIGYGNPLRMDDSLGLRAAEKLLETLPAGQCEIIAIHQLTPELTEKVALAEKVAFVDASCHGNGRRPGSIRQQPVDPEQVPAAGLSHHVSPESLVVLADRLYGRAPEAVLFTVEALSFDLGEGLTPPVQAALPELIERISDWVK